MSLARNAIQLQVSKIAQVLLALGASVALARTLGPQGAGIYAAALAFAVLVQGISSLGFEDLVLARGPLFGGDSARARSLYRSTVRLRLGGVLFFSLAGGLTLLFGVPDPFGSHSSVTLACAFFYAGLNSFATLGATIQAARLRAASTSLLDTTWSLLVTASYAVLALEHKLTVERALIATVLAQLAVDVGYAAILLPLGRTSRRRDDGFRPGESLLFWLNGLLSIGVGKTSDVLAMRVAGATASSTGIYNSAFNAFQTATQFFTQGLGTIVYVGFGRSFSRDDPGGTATAWRTTVVVSSIASLPPLAVCIVLSREVVSLLYGPSFRSAGSAIVILAVAAVVSRILGGGSNQALLFLAERQRTVLVIRGVVVTLNVLLDFALFRAFGVPGVAVASGASGMLITVIEFAYCRPIAPLQVPVGVCLRILLPFLGSAFLARWLVYLDSNLGTVVKGSLSMLLGVALLFVVKPLRLADLPEGTAKNGRAAGILRRLTRV